MPAELVRAVRRDPVLLPALLLPDRARSSTSSAPGRPGRRTSWTSKAQLLELYQDQGLAEKPALLEHRGGAFYSEAAAQLIASLHDGAGDVQVVDVRNDGALPDLPDAAVVEVPATDRPRRRASPRPSRRSRPSMRGLVQAVKAYEELAVEAAR